MYKYIFLVLTLACFSANAELRTRPSNWATPLIGSGLSNIYKVDDGLYRSEQPGAREFNELSKFGITDILNLRNYHEDVAEKSSLKLHRIKMDAGSMTEQHIIESLKIIKAKKGAIIVHCWHGSDRTGTIIAAYRLVFNDWTKEQAVDEMVNGGFGYHASVFPNLVELINGLDVKKIKAILAE